MGRFREGVLGAGGVRDRFHPGGGAERQCGRAWGDVEASDDFSGFRHGRPRCVGGLGVCSAFSLPQNYVVIKIPQPRSVGLGRAHSHAGVTITIASSFAFSPIVIATAHVRRFGADQIDAAALFFRCIYFPT